MQPPQELRALPAPLLLFPVAFLHSFAAGDVVLIQPENRASDLWRFCQALGLDPDQYFTLQPREPGEPWGGVGEGMEGARGLGGGPRARGVRGSGPSGLRACPALPMSLPPPTGVPCPAQLPQPCSVRHLVAHYLDIASVPRRSFFELLACLSPHELEREKLLQLSSPQGQEELYSYCNRPRRTILEV